MSQPVLVIGPSGTGKSTSVENLDSKVTFVIKTTDKPMPFRGSNRKYKSATSDNPKGNMMALKSEDPARRYSELCSIIKAVDEKRDDIKTLIIDDFQYLMVDEYMSRSQEKGFDKFAQMANNMWCLLDKICRCRESLTIIILCHNDIGDDGISTMQTMGKMLRNTVKPEGKFTVILHTYVHDGKYKFLTQYRTVGGKDLQAKSPRGMFDEDFIDNDLGLVVKQMNDYYNEEFADDTVNL
jgi:adenosyl cobinamide kinase/adenosyl cobinamide phosphate guanylyltransferase